MFIKLTFVVESLYTVQPGMTFDSLGKDQKTTVILRPPNQKESESGYHYHTICEACTEVTPYRKALQTFEALWEGRVPPDADLSILPDSTREVLSTGLLENDGVTYELPLRCLNSTVRKFLDEIYNELMELQRRVIATASWRSSEVFPPYLLRQGRMLYSMDGERWLMTPVDISTYGERPAFLPLDLHMEIDRMLRASEFEPLGHELFREAWTQLNSTPRSALAIGISALEAGLKELISELVPDAEWLVKNLPSPPVTQILREYLPSLPIKAQINVKTLAPPDQLINIVKNGVTLRNSLVHGNLQGVEVASVKKLLQAVQDLLWLFDFYRGREWAIEYISQDTRTALGL